MEQKIVGSYDDPIFLQINYPKIADVSSVDYTAIELKGDDEKTRQRPFVICHNEGVTLKVETWKGDVIVWTFTPGPYPMPLKKIFKYAGNTATSIQIAY